MKKGFLKSSKELRHSLFAVVFLAIIFGFNDPSDVFTLSSWLGNLLIILVLAAITLFIHIISSKLAASHFDQKAELRIWGMEKIKFNILGMIKVNSKIDWNILGFKVKFIPFGILIGLLLTLMSMGTFYFTSLTTIVLNKTQRIGDEYLYLREKNEALIYVSSLAGNLALIAIFSLLEIHQGVVIGSYFVLWSLLPVSDLLGAKIFFNNRILYVFFLVFILLFLLLLGIINLAWLVVICLVFAFLITLWYFLKIEYK